MSGCRRAACVETRKTLGQLKTTVAELLGRNDALNHAVQVLVRENRRLEEELSKLSAFTSVATMPRELVCALCGGPHRSDEHPTAEPEEWEAPHIHRGCTFNPCVDCRRATGGG